MMAVNSAPAAPVAPVASEPASPVQATLPLEPVAHVAPAVPAAPSTVTIPLEQLQTFTAIQARLAQVEAEQRTRDEASKAERIRLLAEKGEALEAVKLLQSQREQDLATERSQREVEQARSKRYARDGELARALASQPLVGPHAAQQLTQLWAGQLEAHAEGDSYVVRTPTFQTAADFVKEQLGKPEFSHFVRASTQGGAGSGAGSSQAAPTAPAIPPAAPAPVVPANLGEAVVLQMQEIAKKRNIGDGRLDSRLGFGLGRTRQA